MKKWGSQQRSKMAARNEENGLPNRENDGCKKVKKEGSKSAKSG